jgi:hypothetical protein
MTALKARKFIDLTEVNNFLRGGVIGGKDLKSGGVFGLGGKTLVFTSPSATVTFATAHNSSQEVLTLKDILAQINAVGALTGYAKSGEGHIFLEDPAGSTKVVLSNTGTANALLGFDPDGVSGIVFAAPGGTPPALISVDPLSLSGGGYVVTTVE